jgi:hypothetical protein
MKGVKARVGGGAGGRRNAGHYSMKDRNFFRARVVPATVAGEVNPYGNGHETAEFQALGEVFARI